MAFERFFFQISCQNNGFKHIYESVFVEIYFRAFLLKNQVQMMYEFFVGLNVTTRVNTRSYGHALIVTFSPNTNNFIFIIKY